jgi:Arc/MetJ-type ribon-helix-helix transcriptional regulator
METETRGKYTTVHIPTVLARDIDEIIENEQCAYSSRSEFIKDAVRRLLEYYGYYPKANRNFNVPDLQATTPHLNNRH